jgi:hypothetical protein
MTVPRRFRLTAEYVERQTQRPFRGRDAKYLFNIRLCRREERGAHVDGDCVQTVVDDQIVAHLLEKTMGLTRFASLPWSFCLKTNFVDSPMYTSPQA